MIYTTGGWSCPSCGEYTAVGLNHACKRYSGTFQIVPEKPIGCICPPGANKDCERLDCPRRAVNISAGMVNR